MTLSQWFNPNCISEMWISYLDYELPIRFNKRELGVKAKKTKPRQQFNFNLIINTIKKII